MRILRLAVPLISSGLLLLFLSGVAFGQTKTQSSPPQTQPDQSQRIDNGQATFPATLLSNIDQSTATVTGADRGLQLFQGFTGKEFRDFFGTCDPKNAKVDFPVSAPPNCDSRVYGILHIVKWGDTDKTAKKQSIIAQNWYLYSFSRKNGTWQADDLSKAAHLPGVGNFYFLFVQLNVDSGLFTGGNPSQYYIVNITKKTPANLAHLLALAQAAGLATTPPSTGKAPGLAPVSGAYWGGGYVSLKYKTSTVQIVSFNDNGTVTPTQLGQTSYDNEGVLYWDLSVAIPIRKISQVQIDNANGTLAPVSVNNENVFAVFDGYFPGLDPTSNVIEHWPHPLGGVSLASQPLHKFMVGGAWGPSFSEIYVAALWVKQPILPNSSSCSSVPSTTTGPATAEHFCKQLSIGLNVQISSVLSQITKKK
jgi:hypothetical protein